MNNQIMIEKMIDTGVLKSPEIIDAFRYIDRKYFIPEEFKDFIYMDRPLPLGEKQTISQPSTVAFMLELLQSESGNYILDIGSGSGWTTALLCHIVGDKGSVLGIERVESLVEKGRKNLSQFNFISQCKIEKGSKA